MYFQFHSITHTLPHLHLVHTVAMDLKTIPEQRAPTSLAIVIGFRLSLIEMYLYRLRVITFIQVHAFNGALDTFELKQEFSLISEVIFFKFSMYLDNRQCPD